MTTEKLKTTGEIATDLNVHRHIVEYAIQRHRITESQRAGIIRLFDQRAIEAIKQAVKRTTGKKFTPCANPL